MKKIICAFLALCLLSGIFAGCGEGTAQSNKIKIVTTVFPAYDWVRNILGDEAKNFEITLLTDNGVDLHSYQPTAEDIVDISSCGLFVYVGGESDKWVEKINLTNAESRQTVKLTSVLGAALKTEEAVEGMQSENEGDGEEIDEHVWLSLKNAKSLCTAIFEALCRLSPEKKDYFSERLENYLVELSALDSEYESTVTAAKRKTLLFGDRFPFRYLTEDYSLTYYAAFPGCSAETGASFETVAFLVKKLEELNLPCVLTVDGAGQKTAEAIVNGASGVKPSVLSLCSMQAVTAEDIKNGISYLSAMSDNLEALKKALN